MYNSSQSFVNAMVNTGTSMHIKLEIFTSDYKFIKELTKEVSKDLGTLMISYDSPIRRSFKLTLDNSDGEFLFGEQKLIWIGKKIKLFVGLKTWKNEIEYIPLGIFIITDPGCDHTTGGNTTTINAVDKAYLMTDKRGKFVNEFIISTGANIPNTIKLIAGKVGETMFNFETPDIADLNTKYEIVYSGQDNYWNAIQELASMAKCTVYYDVNGYLCLRKISLTEFDDAPVTWKYIYGSKDEKLYAGNARSMNTSELYNDIVVIGGGSSTSAVMYRLTVDETNPIWANHPYSVQKIGWNTYFHNGNSPDPILLTVDDCKFRAKKLLMDHLGFDEQIQLSISPNFLHDCGDIIYLQDTANGITGNNYMIKSINMPLSPGIMTMDINRYNPVIENWDFI